MLGEDFPTPPRPEQGSQFDADHASKQTSSLQEAKQRLSELWNFIAQFEQREIEDVTGQRFFILAQDVGPGAGITPAEWRIRRSPASSRYQVMVGTVNGLGANIDPPVGKTVGEWYEFAAPERVAVVLTFTFTPNVEERTYGETTFYAIDHGGTLDAGYTMELLAIDSLPDPTHPTVNPSAGATTSGTYRIIVGFAGPGLNPFNSYLGPININFCAPKTFYAANA